MPKTKASLPNFCINVIPTRDVKRNKISAEKSNAGLFVHFPREIFDFFCQFLGKSGRILFRRLSKGTFMMVDQKVKQQYIDEIMSRDDWKKIDTKKKSLTKKEKELKNTGVVGETHPLGMFKDFTIDELFYFMHDFFGIRQRKAHDFSDITHTMHTQVVLYSKKKIDGEDYFVSIPGERKYKLTNSLEKFTERGTLSFFLILYLPNLYAR